jgi:hypothetical protein
MKKKITSGLILVSALFVVSCNNGSDIEVNIQDSDTTVNEYVESINTNELSVAYSVPTPNELFDIIRSSGGELRMDLINSLDNVDKYVDSKSKALNFGVYSADLGYMSCFDNGVEFLQYTKAIEKLGLDIGISDVFDQELMDKIEKNEGNSDSLFLISNETYYDSYQYLEENGKGVELALIIVGGYVESLYIVSHLVDNYSDDNPIIERIGGQKVVLENLIDFCMTYMDDVSVNETIQDLMDLEKIFDENMDFVEEETKVTDVDGIAMVQGGGHYKMNEKTFNAVKTKITELRNKITQNI